MAKILLVISKFYPEYTGAAHRLNLMYRRLKEQDQNLHVTVICNSTSFMKSEEYVYEGQGVYRRVFPFHMKWMPLKIKSVLKTYYEFISTWRCMARQKPDLIHVAGFSGGTMAAILYARLHKIPRLIELVTKDASPAQYLPALRYPKFLALDKQCVIVAISRNIADNCADLGLRENTWCRPNPVDEHNFFYAPERRNTLRRELSPFADDDIVIGMVAKFMPQKNQIFMIDVLHQLPENYKLLLAGPRVHSGIFQKRDDDYFANIEKKIKDLNLQNRVHIHADFVDAALYMMASDLYVMPQNNEGLGTPMLEAMACGLPVVANSEEPAFCEWVQDSENGFLVGMDYDQWAEALIKAAKFKADQKQRAAEKILSQASTAQIDLKYQKILKALLLSSPHENINIGKVL